MTENLMRSMIRTKRAVRIGRRTFVAALAASGVGYFLMRRPLFAAMNTKSDGFGPGNVTIVDFTPDGKSAGKVSVAKVIKTDAEWKAQLSGISYEVTRHEGTERPYTGSTWNLHDAGIFHCVGCATPIFSSETKFESGTGWPSFWQPIAPENVARRSDSSLGMERTEVRCPRCDAHLGHVFDDGPRPTGLRYCMNSAAMNFVKRA